MFLIRNISKQELMITYLHIFSFVTGILKELDMLYMCIFGGKNKDISQDCMFSPLPSVNTEPI